MRHWILLLLILTAANPLSANECNPEVLKQLLSTNRYPVSSHLNEFIPMHRCNLCGEEIHVTRNTLDHMQTHFLKPGQDPYRNFNDTVLLARDHVSTRVFSSDITVDDVLEAIKHPLSLHPDKKAEAILSSYESHTLHEADKIFEEKGITNLAFDMRVEIRGEIYEVRVVTCEKNSCGEGSVKGDIVSIIPLCGPQVYEIPRRSKVRDNHFGRTIIRTCH
jgi:hypothetical protein